MAGKKHSETQSHFVRHAAVTLGVSDATSLTVFHRAWDETKLPTGAKDALAVVEDATIACEAVCELIAADEEHGQTAKDSPSDYTYVPLSAKHRSGLYMAQSVLLRAAINEIQRARNLLDSQQSSAAVEPSK